MTASKKRHGIVHGHLGTNEDFGKLVITTEYPKCAGCCRLPQPSMAFYGKGNPIMKLAPGVVRRHRPAYGKAIIC